jgi:hypothetical protein
MSSTSNHSWLPCTRPNIADVSNRKPYSNDAVLPEVQQTHQKKKGQKKDHINVFQKEFASRIIYPPLLFGAPALIQSITCRGWR